VERHKLSRRPMTAFMIFCGEQRSAVLSACVTRQDAATLGQMLLERWRAIDAEQRAALEERARADLVFLRETQWVAPQTWREQERVQIAAAAAAIERPMKKSRKSKSPRSVKNAMTAYMFFSKAVRPRLRKSNPTATFGELGKLIGNGWRCLPQPEREPYEILAQLDRQRFVQAKSREAAAAGEAAAVAAGKTAGAAVTPMPTARKM